MIDPELREAIAPELTENEELLWAGRPQKHPYLYLAMFEFGIVLFWIGGALYLLFDYIHNFLAPNEDTSTSLLIFLMIVGVCCLFLLIGFSRLKEAIFDLFGSRHQIYAVTNKRALIVEHYWKKRSLSLDRTALSIMHKANKKTLGTLTFGFPEILKKKHKERLSLMHPIRLAPIFYNIENPDQVEALVLEHFQFRGTP